MPRKARRRGRDAPMVAATGARASNVSTRAKTAADKLVAKEEQEPGPVQTPVEAPEEPVEENEVEPTVDDDVVEAAQSDDEDQFEMEDGMFEPLVLDMTDDDEGPEAAAGESPDAAVGAEEEKTEDRTSEAGDAKTARDGSEAAAGQENLEALAEAEDDTGCESAVENDDSAAEREEVHEGAERDNEAAAAPDEAAVEAQVDRDNEAGVEDAAGDDAAIEDEAGGDDEAAIEDEVGREDEAAVQDEVDGDEEVGGDNGAADVDEVGEDYESNVEDEIGEDDEANVEDEVGEDDEANIEDEAVGNDDGAIENEVGEDDEAAEEDEAAAVEEEGTGDDEAAEDDAIVNDEVGEDEEDTAATDSALVKEEAPPAESACEAVEGDKESEEKTGTDVTGTDVWGIKEKGEEMDVDESVKAGAPTLLVKQEPRKEGQGDGAEAPREEESFLVSDLRDLCPSVPLDPPESISESLRATIQCSVKLFIERLLQASKGAPADSEAKAARDGSAPWVQQRTYGCSLCNTQLEQPELFDCHTDSMKHVKRLRWMYFMGLNKELSQFNCKVCHISLPCRDHLVGHLRSDRHACLSKALGVHPAYGEYMLRQHYPKAKVQSILAESRLLQKTLGEKGKNLSAAQKRKNAEPWVDNSIVELPYGAPYKQPKQEPRKPAGLESREREQVQRPGTQEQDAKGSQNRSFIFHCELCQVVVPREHHLQEHYKGKKHRTKLLEHERAKMAFAQKAATQEATIQESADREAASQEAGGQADEAMYQEAMDREAAYHEAAYREAVDREATDQGAADRDTGGREAAEEEAAYQETTEEVDEVAEQGEEETFEEVNANEGDDMELEEEEAAGREEEGGVGSAECRESGQGDVPQQDNGKKGSVEGRVTSRDSSTQREEEKRKSGQGKEAGKDRREDKREGGKTPSDRKPTARTDRSHERSSGGSTRKAVTRSEPRKAEPPRRTETRRSEPRKPEPRRLEPKRDVDSWREPRLPRADPPRADPPRDLKRRAPETDAKSPAAKRSKFNCFVCKLVLYSEKEYREHFNSRGHRYEVSRKEQKETRPAPKRARSPLPFVCQPHQRSRSPPAASSAGRWRRERDPSPRPFAESLSSRSTPRQPPRTDLFGTPQQPMRDTFGATQQPVHDVFGAPLPQASAVLENYTERRDAPDPAVAATLENMILLQQRLLTMTANAPPAVQRTITQGLQQGLQQVVQPVLQHTYQQQTAQQPSYGSLDYSQQRSTVLPTQVPDLQQSLMQLRQSQQYSVLNSYQQQHQMANATSNVAATYLNSGAGQHVTTSQLGSVSQYGSVGQQGSMSQQGSSVGQHASVSQHRGVSQRGATSQQGGGVGQHARSALSTYQSSTVDGSVGSYTTRRKGAAVQPLKKSGGAFQQSPATRQGQAPASSLGYGGASLSDGRRSAQGTLGQYGRSNLTAVRSSGFSSSLAKRY